MGIKLRLGYHGVVEQNQKFALLPLHARMLTVSAGWVDNFLYAIEILIQNGQNYQIYLRILFDGQCSSMLSIYKYYILDDIRFIRILQGFTKLGVTQLIHTLFQFMQDLWIFIFKLQTRYLDCVSRMFFWGLGHQIGGSQRSAFIFLVQYYIMEKDNKPADTRLSERKIFPNLRKTFSATRNFITLSKVEIDKNVCTAEQTSSNFLPRDTATSFSHKRMISGVNSTRQMLQSQISKTYRNFNENPRPLENLKQKSISITNLKEQAEKSQQVPLIEKARISTKPIGAIQGYSVNSHPGSLSTNNEDRICVITNLNKASTKDSQVSFFSIYDGKNGVAKAEYFRDNFHVALVKDKDFTKDIETSIRRAILFVQDSYTKLNSQVQVQKFSSTNLLLCIIMDHNAYIASMGDNKITVSSQKGKQIRNPLMSKEVARRSNSKTKLKIPKVSATLIKLDLKDVDFILLGSEGLFQNFEESQIGLKVWTGLLERIGRNFHLALGESANKIMKGVFEKPSTKNVSLIMIAFGNAYRCFEENQALELPYVGLGLPNSPDEF